jgi:hypothetical protein
MRIIIESTPHITTIEGVPVRHWTGVSEAGIRCDVFVRLLAVEKDQDTTEFDAELKTMPPPKSVSLGEILI